MLSFAPSPRLADGLEPKDALCKIAVHPKRSSNLIRERLHLVPPVQHDLLDST